MSAVPSPHAAVPVSNTSVHVSPAGGPPFEVVYERRGSGEPLVLLHGVGHHWQAWEPVLAALAASHEVYALDLPGFGASPALPDGVGYDPQTLVPLLAETFGALGLDRPHIAGNSLGGLLALGLGAIGRVRSVTALSPGGFWSSAESRYALAVLHGMRAGAKAMPDTVVRKVARTAAGRAVLTGTIYARPGRRSPEAVLAETRALRNAAGFNGVLTAEPGGLGVFEHDVTGIPVTVAWGDKDRLLLPRQGVRAKKTIPGARLVRLRGCGHVPMNDDPATVARVITDTTAQAAR